MTDDLGRDYRIVALAFTEALSRRDYPAAYAMTSAQFRSTTSLEFLQESFEAIVPIDWGRVGPIEIGTTMESWPGREPNDLGWAYVGIGGDVYSEAVTVVIMIEEHELRVRAVEFGRP